MATVVEQFNEIAVQLIKEAVAYVGKGEPDPETSNNISQLLVMTATLNTALNQAQALTRFRPPGGGPG